MRSQGGTKREEEGREEGRGREEGSGRDEGKGDGGKGKKKEERNKRKEKEGGSRHEKRQNISLSQISDFESSIKIAYENSQKITILIHFIAPKGTILCLFDKSLVIFKFFTLFLAKASLFPENLPPENLAILHVFSCLGA